MGDEDRGQPVMLEYGQPERPFETPAQRVLQGCFAAFGLVSGMLCLLEGNLFGAMAFLGTGAFYAMVMFFPLHHRS